MLMISGLHCIRYGVFYTYMECTMQTWGSRLLMADELLWYGFAPVILVDTRWAGRRVEADSLSCATARYFDPCSKRGPTFDWTMVPGSLQHLSVVSSDSSPHHSLGEHARYLITYTIVAFHGSTNGIIGYLARPFRVTGHDGSSSSSTPHLQSPPFPLPLQVHHATPTRGQ